MEIHGFQLNFMTLITKVPLVLLSKNVQYNIIYSYYLIPLYY